MLTTFRKFVGFTVLEYFLKYPTEQIHLNELAKTLRISSRSAKIYCDLFEKENIIHRKIRGNVHLFYTNNDHFFVREMKRTYMASVLTAFRLEAISEDCASLALYGSHASGTYDEKSDIDLLVIGEEHQVDRKRVVEIMDSLGKEIQLTVIPIVKWENMKKANDPFVHNILRNHMLIKGVDL